MMTVNSTCLGLSLVLIVLLAASLLIAGRAARPESSDPRPHRETLAITVAIGAEPTRLDPHDARDAPSSLINYHIYDRLVDVGRRWRDSPRPRADRGRSLPTAGSTPSLCNGVSVSTTASPSTASAVVANFERLLAPGSYLSRGAHQPLCRIDRCNRRRDNLHPSPSPPRPFLRYLSHESLGIVSPRSIEAAKEGRALPPVGTGPFVLKEWVPGDRVTLVAFPANTGGEPPRSTCSSLNRSLTGAAGRSPSKPALQTSHTRSTQST